MYSDTFWSVSSGDLWEVGYILAKRLANRESSFQTGANAAFNPETWTRTARHVLLDSLDLLDIVVELVDRLHCICISHGFCNTLPSVCEDLHVVEGVPDVDVAISWLVPREELLSTDGGSELLYVWCNHSGIAINKRLK